MLFTVVVLISFKSFGPSAISHQLSAKTLIVAADFNNAAQQRI
jgi:hypothetical protein